MSNFFVNVHTGRVATRRQLVEAGHADDAGRPPRPWHEIQGPRDASTLWYAVLRKRDRGVFIGTLCLRHTARQTSLEDRGWEEVPVEAIGVEAPGPRGAVASSSPLPGGGSPRPGGAQPPR